MDPIKAKMVMKLIFTENLQLKGLRELKKRLLDSANIPVFRKLKLVPHLLKVIEEHSTKCPPQSCEDDGKNETLTTHNPDEYYGEFSSVDEQDLGVEDLQKLIDLSYSTNAQEARSSVVILTKIGKVDPASQQILLDAMSLLCTMLQDHGVKQQCDQHDGVRVVLPFITCQCPTIAERAIRATAHMVELPGRNQDLFIKFNGPQLLVKLFLEPHIDEASFRKTLLNSIRIVSCWGACCRAILQDQGLQSLCSVGLTTPELHQAAVSVIAVYSSVRQQEALVQLLDGTKELSLLIQVWQNNRSCATIHSCTLRVIVNLVELAAKAKEQIQSNSPQTWVASSNSHKIDRSFSVQRELDNRGVSNLAALRLRLLKAFFAVKTATPLVTEIANFGGAAGEKIISTLCTLCDGSLEPKASASGCSNIALVWLQVVNAGGVKPFVSLLLKGDPSSESFEGDQQEAVGLFILQKKILRAMLAVENNHELQETVFKHCLASGILPALTMHFDATFARYQACLGSYTETSVCEHQRVAQSASPSCAPAHSVFDASSDVDSNLTVPHRTRSKLSPDLKQTSSGLSMLDCSKVSTFGSHPSAPPLAHPLAPVSPPSSPQDSPKYVYTPYSPPLRKAAKTGSTCSSQSSPMQFQTSYSPDSSPPHFLPYSPSSSPTHFPSYSPIKPGCSSPSFQGNWSSPSCSPQYSPGNSPSYSPSHSPSYSPSHSPSYSPSHSSAYSSFNSPTFSPSLSPSHSPSGSLRSSRKNNLPTVVDSISTSIVNQYEIKENAENDEADTRTSMKRNICSSGNVTEGSSKRLKVILHSTSASPPSNKFPDERNNFDETDLTVGNRPVYETRCLTEMVREKLLESDAVNQLSFSDIKRTSGVTQKNESDMLHTLQKPDSVIPDSSFDESSKPSIASAEEASSHGASRSSITSTLSSTVIKSPEKVVHVRNMNHIKFRVGKRARERRSTEPHIKTVAIQNDMNVSDYDANERKHVDTTSTAPTIARATEEQDSNAHSYAREAKRLSDDEAKCSPTSFSVFQCQLGSSIQEAALCNRKKEDVPPSEDSAQSMDFIEGESEKPAFKGMPAQLGRTMQTTRTDKETSEHQTKSVIVREFNHIKFRVGKRAKDKHNNAGQTSVLLNQKEGLLQQTGSASPAQSEDSGVPRDTVGTCSSVSKASSLPSSSREVWKTRSLEYCAPEKVTASDTLKACESKLSDCRLSKREVATSKESSEVDRHNEGAMEETLRHLELVVRIITQVCQIREALSGVCREFLPRVMLYLRYSYRLHPAASRFLSTISQTPCGIQGLLDTFFPAYVAVELCESLIDSKKKSSPCDCSPCDDFSPRDDCSPRYVTQKCLCSSSEESDKDNRCSSRNANVCSQCSMLVKGGQSFLYNMSKFFGHVHQYGSQEAANRLRPGAHAYVRETCALNIPHIARCPLQLQQLLLNGGGLQVIFNILKEDEPPSAVRYIYAAAALHAVAKAVNMTCPGKHRCSTCLINAACCESEEASSDKPRTFPWKAEDLSKNSAVDRERCFWSEQVDHDITLVCTDEEELMEHRKAWRYDDGGEYSEEELSDPESLDDDASSIANDCGEGNASFVKSRGESSLKSNVSGDDGLLNIRGKDFCSNDSPSNFGIQAHRSLLCEASEVWAAMLEEQRWREASDGVIRIGSLGNQALTAVVHYLYGCRCAALTSLPLHAYIELLHASNMYGLEQLKMYATHRIVDLCCTATDVLSVYQASVGLINKDIIMATLVRLLACKKVRSWRRAQWLHNIAHSPSGDHLLQDMHDLLVKAFQTNSAGCTCDTSQSLYMTSHSVYSKLV